MSPEDNNLASRFYYFTFQKEYNSPLPTTDHENTSIPVISPPTVDEDASSPRCTTRSTVPNVTPTKRSRLINSLFGKRIKAKQAHLKASTIKPNETQAKINLQPRHRRLSKADISLPENFVYVGGSNIRQENVVYVGECNTLTENTVYDGGCNNRQENVVYVGESNTLMENTVYDGGCNNRLPESTQIVDDHGPISIKINTYKNAADIDNFIKLSPEMQVSIA